MSTPSGTPPHPPGDPTQPVPLPSGPPAASAAPAGATPPVPPVPPTQQMPPVPPTQQLPTPAFPDPGPEKANLWRQATSTTGARWATGIAAGALASLLVLSIAFALFAFTRHDRLGPAAARPDAFARERGDPGGGSGGEGLRGSPNRPGAPRGLVPRSLPGFGALHGEVTITGSDGKPVVMLVQRGQVTAVNATSITVKSTDGLTGTYVIEASNAPARRAAARLAQGDEVGLVARKSDRVVTRLGAHAQQRVLTQ